MKNHLPFFILLSILCATLAACSTIDASLGASDAPSYSSAAAGSFAAARAAVDVSTYRTAKPHPKAANVPADLASRAFGKPSSGLPRLVSWLTEGVEDQYEKAKILHDWEALSISYDVKAFYSGSIPEQSADSVLARRRAVCAGYAALYKRLCDAAGIDCAVVSGQARGTGFAPGGPTGGHDWNAIRIGGVWRLVDVTWDSCYVNSPSEYGNRYSSAYFLLDPEFMIYTHFPASAPMQLLDAPLSYKQFEFLPYADGEFLSMTRRTLSPLSMINASTGISSFDVPHAEGVRIYARLFAVSKKSASPGDSGKGIALPVVEGEGKATVPAAFPSPGDFTILMFAEKEGSESGSGCCQVRFAASAASTRSFVSFDSGFLKIVGLPREGGLIDGRVKKEIGFTFPCGPETKIQAYLNAGEGDGATISGAAVVARVEGGSRVEVAFPGTGKFRLILTADAPGKALRSSALAFVSEEAADHGYLDFSTDFLDLAGSPLEGNFLSDRQAPEFALTFPAPVGLSLTAALMGSPKTGAGGKASYVIDRSARRSCLVRRVAGGFSVRVAFPGPGSYRLWLEAVGADGRKAYTGVDLVSAAGAGHGFMSFDKELLDFAGMPSLLGSDGASLGYPVSDIVGERLDLLFPKSDAELEANLYIPVVAGSTTRYEHVEGAKFSKTAAGMLLRVAFPKPGEYAVFVRGRKPGEDAMLNLGGLYLRSGKGPSIDPQPPKL